MKKSELTGDADERITLLFPPEQQDEVRRILIEECGNNLPFCSGRDAVELDRYRFAALKLSNGDLEKLRRAVRLANKDWRDLLVAAGFAVDPIGHRSWMPERKW